MHVVEELERGNEWGFTYHLIASEILEGDHEDKQFPSLQINYVFYSEGHICFNHDVLGVLFEFPFVDVFGVNRAPYKKLRKGGKSETMINSILFILCSSHPFICLRFSPLLTEGLLLAAGLIDAAATDVTHPFDDIVIAVIEL